MWKETSFRLRALQHREDVGVVPGMQLHRVATTLDRDDVAKAKMRMSAKPVRPR
jgi:hypothetical protein